MVSAFVAYQRDEKGERTYETYGRKIFVFQEYLETKKAQNIIEEKYRAFLRTIKISDILESVEYYVLTYNIRYKSTTDSYLAALFVFFSYIQEKLGIQNEYFDINSKSKELRASYEEQVKQLKLNIGEQAMPILPAEFERLVKICDKNIDNVADDELVNGNNNGVYSLYISSLITKFVLLFGTRNKIISEININDYDHRLNKITIRGYSVHLPDKLASQMHRYLIVRQKIIASSSPNEHLFVDFNASQKLENAKMFFVLKSTFGTTKALTISKYAIIQMMKNRIPLSSIMGFTGFSQTVCVHCQEIIEEQNGISNSVEKNRQLDAALRQSETFDNL